MRLYTRTGATAQTDPDTGEVYEPDEQGGFDFPDELGERLHRFHIGKQRQWEDEEQRHQRIVNEEMERAKDPATLLAVVQQLAMLAKAAIPAQAATATPAEVADDPAQKAPARRASKRTASSMPPADE